MRGLLGNLGDPDDSAAEAVLGREGNEAPKEGRREVGAPRSTEERGEPSPEGPAEGKAEP
jgi:hypothetical protein